MNLEHMVSTQYLVHYSPKISQTLDTLQFIDMLASYLYISWNYWLEFAKYA